MSYTIDTKLGSPLTNKSKQETHHGVPMWPARTSKLIRVVEKAYEAGRIHRFKTGAMPKVPKNAITIKGWTGSNPKKEVLYAWVVGTTLIFSTPHNDKAGYLDLSGDGVDFVGTKYRTELGLKPVAKKATKKVVKMPAKKAHKKVLIKHRKAA